MLEQSAVIHPTQCMNSNIILHPYDGYPDNLMVQISLHWKPLYQM